MYQTAQGNWVDRYKLEKEALQQFNRFVGRNAFILHQRDPVLSEVLRDVGYNSILGPDGMVRSGKAEGMVIGMLPLPRWQVKSGIY